MFTLKLLAQAVEVLVPLARLKLGPVEAVAEEQWHAAFTMLNLSQRH